MKRLIAALVNDESGQDLIEYALLTTFIGLASVIGIGLFRGAISSTYTSWNTEMDNIWESPNPI